MILRRPFTIGLSSAKPDPSPNGKIKAYKAQELALAADKMDGRNSEFLNWLCGTVLERRLSLLKALGHQLKNLHAGCEEKMSAAYFQLSTVRPQVYIKSVELDKLKISLISKSKLENKHGHIRHTSSSHKSDKEVKKLKKPENKQGHTSSSDKSDIKEKKSERSKQGHTSSSHNKEKSKTKIERSENKHGYTSSSHKTGKSEKKLERSKNKHGHKSSSHNRDKEENKSEKPKQGHTSSSHKKEKSEKKRKLENSPCSAPQKIQKIDVDDPLSVTPSQIPPRTASPLSEEEAESSKPETERKSVLVKLVTDITPKTEIKPLVKLVSDIKPKTEAKPLVKLVSDLTPKTEIKPLVRLVSDIKPKTEVKPLVKLVSDIPLQIKETVTFPVVEPPILSSKPEFEGKPLYELVNISPQTKPLKMEELKEESALLSVVEPQTEPDKPVLDLIDSIPNIVKNESKVPKLNKFEESFISGEKIGHSGLLKLKEQYNQTHNHIQRNQKRVDWENLNELSKNKTLLNKLSDITDFSVLWLAVEKNSQGNTITDETASLSTVAYRAKSLASVSTMPNKAIKPSSRLSIASMTTVAHNQSRVNPRQYNNRNYYPRPFNSRTVSNYSPRGPYPQRSSQTERIWYENNRGRAMYPYKGSYSRYM